MNSRLRFFEVLVALSFLALLPTTAVCANQDSPSIQPHLAKADQDSGSIEPQLVRLRYVEGDVRFNRGDSKGPNLQKPWEKAEADQPIEAGYALSTGEGKAEVEFESGSVIYVAPNSVVLFVELYTYANAFNTRVELISGTLTTDVVPTPGLRFEVDTPDAVISVDHPSNLYLRIDSYLDGNELTPQADGGPSVSQNGGGKIPLTKGETIRFEGNKPMQILGAGQSEGSNDWDKWVAERVAKRHAAMDAAMKASGLTTPMAGLADLYEEGTFYACPPYGTCWEQKPGGAEQMDARPGGSGASIASPTEPNASSGRARVQLELASWSPAAQSASAEPASQTETSANQESAQGAPPSAGFVPRQVPYLISWDQCPYQSATIGMVDARTQAEYARLMKLYEERSALAWTRADWVVCHYGRYYYHQGGYRIVIGHKKHHHPVHWVKQGGKVGFVLPHPRDQEGKPPINLKHGIFLAPAKPGGEVKLVHYDPKAKIELAASAPKEFRGEFPHDASIVPPEIRGRVMDASHVNPKLGAGAEKDLKLRYDYASRGFVIPGKSVGGKDERPVMVASLSDRGGFGAAGYGTSTLFSGHAAGGSRGGGSSYSGGGAGYRGGGGYSGGHSGGGGGYSGGGGGGGGGSHGGGYSGGASFGGAFSGGTSSGAGGGGGGGSSGGRSK